MASSADGSKGFAHRKLAGAQAQVQQARAVLGVAHFERMLQHQQRGLAGERRDPAADAGAGRA
jgi:hypothetical protein